MSSMSLNATFTPDTSEDHKRYLLIDDDQLMSRVTARILKRLGSCSIDMVSDGQEALEALDVNGDYDVIICDLNMPNMDGLQLFRHLAERNVTAPLLLISGEHERILRTSGELARSHGLNTLGFLSKPVDGPSLTRLLDNASNVVPLQLRSGLSELSSDEVMHGIASGRVLPYYQPKIDTVTGRIRGAEALARWRTDDNRILSPAAFVDVAERSGQEERLLSAMLDTIVQDLAIWGDDAQLGTIAVNVPVSCCCKTDLPELLKSKLDRSGINPGRIMIEVTETGVIEDIASALETLTRLRIAGFGIAIDDFGTGQSSLKRLQDIPFTELKIDRAFVSGAVHDDTKRAILEMAIELGDKLGIEVIAEGVERIEDWELVKSLGCDLVQGFLFARPMPGGKLAAWADGWSSRAAMG